MSHNYYNYIYIITAIYIKNMLLLLILDFITKKKKTNDRLHDTRYYRKNSNAL